jgi:hypothetical protein
VAGLILLGLADIQDGDRIGRPTGQILTGLIGIE